MSTEGEKTPSHMFHVEVMNPEDFEFAAKVTESMGWGLANWDFEFMLRLEPKGCFTLYDDSERIGIATTASYGRVGWFGNLIVRPDKRSKGGGSTLVRHALEYLAHKNVETVGLYSYIDKISFYTKLGFKRDSEFAVLKGKAFPSPTNATISKATTADAEAMAKLDENCFGGRRRKLLEAILTDPDNVTYTSSENQRLFAFVMAKVYDGSADIGPLVCGRTQTDAAVNLLRAILSGLRSRDVSVCVPRKESTVIDLLKQHGFSEVFSVARMFKGPSVSSDCVYFPESLERG